VILGSTMPAEPLHGILKAGFQGDPCPVNFYELLAKGSINLNIHTTWLGLCDCA